MTFLKIILWIIIIPYILGKLLENKDENKILYPWVLGYVLQMGIFLVLAIPMILMKCSFYTLKKWYTILIIIVTAVSFVINIKKIIPKIKKTKVSFIQVIAILLVLVQIFIKFRYTNVNNDDSTFVVLGTKMIETGYMYYDGGDSDIIIRRALAPSTAYYAVLAQNLGIHVTIVMHTIIPMLFMAIGSIIFYYFGKKLFKENNDSPYLFLIFMILLYTYFFTTKGAGLYYLKFTWFGRALVGAVFLPLLWSVSLDAMDKQSNKVKDWITMFFIVLTSCLCSEMAVVLVSISFFTIALISSIRDKKISYIFKFILCIIPCIIIGIIYLKLK
jgi:hypothetical protein